MTRSRDVKPIRVLLGKPGLDGHDRGVKVVARALRDAGFEVIYLGLRGTPAEIVAAAVQEDVDVVGISNLSAALVPLCRQVKEALEAAGAGSIRILAGGTVLEEDVAELRAMGIDGVFGPGTDTAEIVAFIRESDNTEREAVSEQQVDHGPAEPT